MKSKRPHILVVDDEEDNRNIITEYLQDDEFRFSMAEDGAIAWEILQQNPGEYDLILLDIMMPKLDGLELLARLKAHQALEQIPVILQTTRGEKYDIANGIEAGAFYYLTKPFHEEVLRSIVQTAISDHRKYLELKAEVDLGGGFSDMMRSGHFVFKTLESSRAIIHFLARACPQPSRVVNGLSELITNAIEHGNLQITYQQKTALIEHETWLQEIESRQAMEEYSNRSVEIYFSRDKDQISFHIKDQGEGFDWSKYMQIDPDRGSHNHGRGIAVAANLSFDSVEYLGKGNEVIATIKL